MAQYSLTVQNRDLKHHALKIPILNWCGFPEKVEKEKKSLIRMWMKIIRTNSQFDPNPSNCSQTTGFKMKEININYQQA